MIDFRDLQKRITETLNVKENTVLADVMIDDPESEFRMTSDVGQPLPDDPTSVRVISKKTLEIDWEEFSNDLDVYEVGDGLIYVIYHDSDGFSNGDPLWDFIHKDDLPSVIAWIKEGGFWG